MAVTPAGTAPVGVVSPHLDDAVLSCARLLWGRPKCHVVTVFSSGPPKVDPLPFWDQMSGAFQPGDDVMAIRGREDDDALALVGAQGHRLGFWDSQYRTARPVRLARLRPTAVRAARDAAADPGLPRAVEERLSSVIGELSALDTWLIPLGLHEGDHELVASACLELARRMPEVRWVVYEELPYSAEDRSKVTRALALARERGFTLEPVEFELDTDPAHKRSVVECHRSQLRALGDRLQTAVDGRESYHRLTAPARAG